MDKKELFERIKADGVEFVSLQFTDVTGAVKSVDAPLPQLEEAVENGLWFDGSSIEGFTRIQESDMIYPFLHAVGNVPGTRRQNRCSDLRGLPDGRFGRVKPENGCCESRSGWPPAFLWKRSNGAGNRG